MSASVDSFDRRPSAHPTGESPTPIPADGTATAGVTLVAGTPATLKHFTLYRGHRERPLQFDGEMLA